MSITLNAIALPDDLHWVDEITWVPVAMAQQRTLGGINVIERSPLVAGRPITLQGNERAAWTSRATLLDLLASAGDLSAPSLTLTIHGEPYSVIWLAPTPIEARPLREGISNPGPEEPYIATFRFITV